MPVSGMREVDQKLKELAEAAGPKKSQRVMKQALRFAATPILKMARAKAPVGSVMHKTYKGRMVAPGFLRRNLDKQVFQTRAGTGVLRAGPRAEAFYGTQFLERGFYTRSPDPWLEPAFDAAKEQAVKRLGEKLIQLVNKELRL